MINTIKKFFGLHVHTWDKWTINEERWTSFPGLLAPQRDPHSYTKTVQIRSCEDCGLTEKKYLD